MDTAMKAHKAGFWGRVRPPARPARPALPCRTPCRILNISRVPALPQRPAGSRPATDRTPSFLLVEKLSSAGSVDEVLQLAERLRQGPAASSFHQVELLAALARCLAGGGSGPKAGSQADAAARVKALLPVLLKDLAAREQLLSFKQLVSVLCSIRALLRMLRLAPPHEAVRLAAALPGAAARSAAPPLPSPSLVELESAFTAARQICVWAEAGGGGGGAEMAAVASQRLRAYVSRVLVEDAARVEGLRATSSLGELAAAIKLAAAFALPQPRVWAKAVAARVDEFVAAALPPETRGLEVEVPEAEQGGAETTAAQERQRPGPARVPGPQSAADKSSAGGAPGAVSAASSNGDSAKGESTSPASDSIISSSSPGVRKSRQARGKSRGSDSRPEASLPAHLDVGSLAALLTAWGVQPPQPHLELDFDFDWPAWMSATAESVWLTQDIATQERRQELLNRIATLEAQRAQKQQQLDKAVSTARRQGTNDSGGGSGGVGDGDGAAGGQPRKGPARGEPRGGRGPAGGRRGKQQLTSGRGPRGGAPGGGGGGPAAAVVDTAALAAAIAGDEASLDSAARELSTLGPVVARESGSGGGSARGAVPQPLGVVQLVELAWTVGRVAGPRCGARGSQLAEQVLRQRLGEMAGQPALVVQSLVAVGLMRPQLDEVTVSLALGQLRPKLSELPPRESLELITLLSTRVAAPPRTPAPREVLEPLAAGVAAAAARDAAPTELVPSLLRLCAGWGVPLPADSLGAVARAVERRVRREMMEGDSTDLALWQSLKESKRYMVESLSGGVVSGDPSSGGGSSGSGGSFLGGLMEGVVLPLAALGQHFEGYETTMAALHRWLEAGLPGLTAAKAIALLGQVAAASGWPHVPLFRKDLELLMVAVLREEWLLGQEVGAAELSQLLLAACRALRVMAAKVVRSGSVPEDAAPRVAPLLLPAVEWLLALQPGADAVAAAMQGLFVELQLPADGGALAGMAAPASGGVGGGASASPPLPPLAARLLSQAEPSLDSDGFSSARSGAFILAACARCGYVPPPHLLTKVYDATRRALRRPTGASPGAVPAASAEVLVSLVESVSRLDAVQAATAGNDAAAEADGGAASAAATAAAAAAARDALLQEVVLGLTTEEALRVLRSQPDRLATALRLVALAGVKDLPDSWIASCAAAVQDLLPALSHRGLAHAASGLALLGARPPAAFVESMLLRAEKAVGGSSNWKRYDVDELGLLLGAAHVLWGGSGREAGGGGQQLSRAAQDAWDRAHINFVSAQADALPRYRPNELQMTVAAVAAYELSRPWAGGGGGGSGGGGKGPTGRSGPGKAASLRPTDYMGGVEAKWVEACGAALLEARRRRQKLVALSGGRLSASELPPAGLLLDVLRLASRVVADSADGSIRQLAAAAGTVDDLAEYVRLSLADWAAAASDDDDVRGRGGPGKPGSTSSLGLSVADWGQLLAAALDAGIQPPAPALAAYGSHLFPLLAEEAGRQQQEQQQKQRPSRTDDGERQRALWAAAESALRRVLLRVLPWVPPTPLTSLLAGEGFLARAPLQAASMGQLGLMCTYCTQAGMVVGKEAVWERLRMELRRRANAAMTMEGAAAAQVNAGAVRRQAGGGPTRQEVAAAAQSDPWVAAGTGPASAADVAAVCYAVQTSGKDPDAAAAVQWLRRLLAEEAAAAAATAGPKSTQRTPKDARAGVPATGGASPGHWYPADSRPLAALAALQRLWVLYGDRCGGSTAGTIDEMEALRQGLKTAFQSEDALDVLLPYQIAQLVELYDTSALGDPNELVAAAPVDAAAGLLPQGVAAAVLQHLAAAVGSDSVVAPPASPALAATALARLLPVATGSGASGRQHLPPWAVVLASVAETALPSLPLRRVAALLMALEGRPGWRLQMPLLQMLVGRLLEQGTEADWRKGDGSDRRAREAVVARRPPPGVAPVDADALSSRELLQVVIALINLASQSQQSQPQLQNQNQNRQHHQPQPTHHPPSPSSCEEVLAAVQPLLERLFPAAEQQLQAAALHEQLARRVRASGAAAAQYMSLRMVADTWGLAFAVESAREASRVMASAVIALLLQHMGTPEAEQQQQQRLEEGRAADQQLQEEPAEAAAAAVPVQAAGALVSALLSSSGDRVLPRPVAAVVLLLLGCEGVVQAVPEAQLRRALITGLVGHEGLPMREDTAAALAARVRTATGALAPLDLARQLRLCGASAVFSHREILRVNDRMRLRGMELEERERFLQEMYESGIQEFPAAGARIYATEVKGDFIQSSDMAVIYLDMVAAMWAWSRPGGPLLSPENLPAVLECFRHLRLIAGRIGKNPGGFHVLAADVARSSGNYTRALVPTRWPEAGGKSSGDPKAWPRLLWAYLDALCEMGPADILHFKAQVDATLTASVLVRAELANPLEPTPWWSRQDTAWSRLGNQAFGDYVSKYGPYILDAGEAASFARALWPSVEAHARAATERSGSWTSPRAAPPPLAAPPPSAPPASAMAGAESGALLSCRQLGLLYGLVALRSVQASAGHEEELERYRDQIWPLYLAALDELVARTDLAPLDHLNAVLDAVQPLVCPVIEGVFWPPHYSHQSVGGGGVLSQLADRLAAVVAPLVSGRVPLPQLWPGEQAEPEYDALWKTFRPPCFGPLGSDLYWPAGSPLRLQLPAALSPPPGRRHGFGDPAGDAAREDFVARLEPWHIAVYRVVMMALELQKGDIVPLILRLVARGVDEKAVARSVLSRYLWRMLERVAVAATLPGKHGVMS
ncbi:hypothetical protein PLESTM_000153000 [Pleodorina starrii]|nr:hypothetical protein PLESTM_000153000 [Pleodorina starrii]